MSTEKTAETFGANYYDPEIIDHIILCRVS